MCLLPTKCPAPINFIYAPARESRDRLYIPCCDGMDERGSELLGVGSNLEPDSHRD